MAGRSKTKTDDFHLNERDTRQTKDLAGGP